MGEGESASETKVTNKEAEKRMGNSESEQRQNLKEATTSQEEIEDKKGGVDHNSIERTQASKVVKKKLSSRPSEKSLIQTGVLKEIESLSSPLQQKAIQLEKNLKRNKIDAALKKRPTLKDVAAQGILPESKISSSLQGIAYKLEKNLAKDSLRHLLDHRPSVKELEKHNIRKGPHTASSLQGAASELEKRFKIAQLGRKFHERPSPSELKKLLPQNKVAPSLQPISSTLARKLSEDKLKRLLETRPQLEELQRKGIIQNTIGSTTSHATSKRARFAIALKGAAKLMSLGSLSPASKGRLKDLILREDSRIMAAVEAFEADHDLEDMLDTFKRVVLVK